MSKLNVIVGNITRAVERLENTTHYYFILSLAVLLVFGVFGSGTLIRELVEKERTREQLVALNVQLRNKLDQLEELTRVARGLEGVSSQVDEFMLKGSSVQNTIADLAAAAARAGFTVNKVTVAQEDENETELALLLEGAGNIVDVISQFESLKETVEVFKVAAWPDREVQQVSIKLKISFFKP